MNTLVNNPYFEKFFLYARKSTDDDVRQVMSIEAQLTELHELAKRENLQVMDELIEKQSAKIPGRPIFNRMLDSIDKGMANGILSWHPDRLARNSVDGGRIIYLIDTGKISTLKFNTFWFEPTPQGKFMLSISFSQSKYYVDSLSENTRRGLRQKARNGYLPGRAPFGYLNDSRTKTIVINKKISPAIKEAFELYSNGNIQIKEVSGFLKTKGIITSNNKQLCIDEAKKILTNPFYFGMFKYGGEVYEGRHDPIITKKLFDNVQEVLNQRNKPWAKKNQDHPIKPYNGIIRCGECGMGITGDYKTKFCKTTKSYVTYHYYRCTKKNKTISCFQPHISESDLDLELTSHIKKYSLSKDWAESMYKMVDDNLKNSAQSSFEAISIKRKDLEQIDIKLKLLLDSYLDQLIDRDDFQEKKFQLMSKKKTLEEQILSLKRNQNNWVEPMKKWIFEASEVDQIVSSKDKEQIKVLASKIFGSNLVLENKTVRGDGINAWSALGADPTGRSLVGVLGFEPRASASQTQRSTN